jgi:hypothetical protein
MRHIGKFAVLGAVLAASASFAYADVINFASTSGTVNFTGSIASGGPFSTNPNTFASNAAPVASSFVSPAGVWSPAIAGSTWVSNNAGAGPGGGVIEPNGYYTYTTTLVSAAGGAYTGTFNIMADDTVAVYLGAPSTINSLSVPFILAGGIGTDAQCADNKPTCTRLDTVSWNPTLATGGNVLTFVVEQTGLASEGLDFAGSISSVTRPPGTPEPNSLILLGTGLVGAAGMFFRRRVTA